MNTKTSAYRPVIPREVGSTKEVVERLYREASGTKQVSFKLGIGLSTAATYSDPGARQQISFDQVRRLTGPGVTAAAEDLAAIAGGHFVPGGDPSEDGMHVLAGRCHREFSEWMAALLEGRSTPEQRRELDEAIQALVAVRVKMNSEDARA